MEPLMRRSMGLDGLVSGDVLISNNQGRSVSSSSTSTPKISKHADGNGQCACGSVGVRVGERKRAWGQEGGYASERVGGCGAVEDEAVCRAGRCGATVWREIER